MAHEKCREKLIELAKLPGNDVCADCGKNGEYFCSLESSGL